MILMCQAPTPPPQGHRGGAFHPGGGGSGNQWKCKDAKSKQLLTIRFTKETTSAAKIASTNQQSLFISIGGELGNELMEIGCHVSKGGMGGSAGQG